MGNYLSQPIKQKQVEEGSNNKFTYTSVGMQGWRVGMEDAHINSLDIDENGSSIFGIFDGHGGKEVAIYVAKNFQKELVNCKEYKSGKFKEALENTFLLMDKMIKQALESKEIDNPNAGCTANVVLFTKDKIFCANSGDSRAIASIKGETQALSVDHKPDDEKEKKRIQKAGGDVYNGRVNGNLNLSRALGDLDYKVNENDDKNTNPQDFMITAFPDITETPFNKEVEFVILGCDGIWECRSNQIIADTFRNVNGSQKEKCEKFLDEILAPQIPGSTSGLDNMSIIVVKIKNS